MPTKTTRTSPHMYVHLSKLLRSLSCKSRENRNNTYQHGVRRAFQRRLLCDKTKPSNVLSVHGCSYPAHKNVSVTDPAAAPMYVKVAVDISPSIACDISPHNTSIRPVIPDILPKLKAVSKHRTVEYLWTHLFCRVDTEVDVLSGDRVRLIESGEGV